MFPKRPCAPDGCSQASFSAEHCWVKRGTGCRAVVHTLKKKIERRFKDHSIIRACEQVEPEHGEPLARALPRRQAGVGVRWDRVSAAMPSQEPGVGQGGGGITGSARWQVGSLCAFLLTGALPDEIPSSLAGWWDAGRELPDRAVHAEVHGVAIIGGGRGEFRDEALPRRVSALILETAMGRTTDDTDSESSRWWSVP